MIAPPIACRPPIVLAPAEIDAVCEALDSHVYWQLSEDHYRDCGEVSGAGADDPDAQAEIAAARALAARLRAAQREHER